MLLYSQFSRAKAIPKTGPHRVYGIFGDGLLQRRVLETLLEAVLPPDAGDWNRDDLDGESASLTDVLSACANVPFLADQRVVLVHRAERLEGIGKADEAAPAKKANPDRKGAGQKSAISPAKRLSEGLANLPETTVLMLCRTPETPEPGARPGAARCINAQIDKVIEEHGLLINCTIDPKNAQMVNAVVQNEATRRHIPLDDGAAEHLVARCGLDLEKLLSELEKCALRQGIGEVVTSQTIDEMTRRAPQETIFDLTDALGDRKMPRALGLLRELVEAGEPPELILEMLARHLRQLLQARAVLDAKLPLDASLMNRMPRDFAAQMPQDDKRNLAVLLQRQSWMGRRLQAQARNFSQEQLRRALERTLDVDLALKGIEGDGGADSKKMPELLLDLFLVELS